MTQAEMASHYVCGPHKFIAWQKKRILAKKKREALKEDFPFRVEAPIGFEPMQAGFANPSLNHLGIVPSPKQITVPRGGRQALFDAIDRGQIPSTP